MATPDLVGRERERRGLLALLAPGVRLALVGPGGVGKSALARAVAAAVPSRWCDLSAARAASDVVVALAAAFGGPVELRTIGSELLVLDGLEHLPTDALAALADRIADAPALAVLATSRRPLAWPGEEVFELGPLATDDAVALFEACVRRRRRDGPPAAEERTALRELVDRLDRLPLAIELAAARRPVLSAAEMLARLDARFKWLRPLPGQPGRGLWDGLADTWSALGDGAREVLAQCTVFRGGFSLAAAEQVVAASGWLPDDLQVLRDWNLLRTDTTPGVTRFHLYESVREFALPFVRDPDALAERHARWMEGFLRRSAERQARGPVGAVRIERAAERWNALAAWEHLRATDPARALGLVVEATAVSTLDAPTPWLHLLERSLAADADPEPALRIRAERARISLLFDQGRYATAAEEGRALLPAAAEWPDEACRLGRVLGQALARTGQAAAGLQALEAALADARRAGSRSEEATILATLCGVRRMLGPADPGLAEEALRLALALDDPWIECLAVNTLATSVDEPARKWDLTQAALAAAQRAGHRQAEAVAHGNLARMLLAADEAAQALAEAEAGVVLALPWPYVHRWLLGFVAGAQVGLGRLGDADATLRAADRVPVESHDRECAALWLERAEWHVARGEIAPAIERLRAVEATGRFDEVLLRRAGLLAVTADPAALEVLDEALAARPATEASSATYDGVVAATRAAATGDEGGRRRAIDQLREALARSEERWTPERLRRRLARLAVGLLGRPATRELVLAADGSWFLFDGARVDLGRRGAQRRILARLAGLGAGQALDVYDLFEVGWPGERADHATVTSRVYNAVQRLRDAGLRTVLEQVEAGYRLDPEVPRSVVPSP